MNPTLRIASIVALLAVSSCTSNNISVRRGDGDAHAFGGGAGCVVDVRPPVGVYAEYGEPDAAHHEFAITFGPDKSSKFTLWDPHGKQIGPEFDKAVTLVFTYDVGKKSLSFSIDGVAAGAYPGLGKITANPDPREEPHSIALDPGQSETLGFKFFGATTSVEVRL